MLLIFGPKRLPTLGRSLGSGMREFCDGITGKSRSDAVAEETPASPLAVAAGSVDTAPAEPPAVRPETVV